MKFILRLSFVVLLSSLCVNVVQAFDWFAKKPSPKVLVQDPFAEMRSGPGRGFPVFYVVEKGESITLLKSRTDWYQVQTVKGKKGWIYRDQLRSTVGANGEVIGFTSTGREDFVQRRWEYGVMGGGFSGAMGVSQYLGVHMTENLSAEFHYTEAFGDISANKLWSLNMVHQPFPRWVVSPFVSLGAGQLNVSPRSSLVQVTDREDSVLNVGGGLVFYATRRLLLRLEYTSHTVLTTREDNDEVHQWKAGFSVFF